MGKVKYIFKEGDKITESGIVFIRDVKKQRRASGSFTRIALIRCFCGKEYEANLHAVASGRRKSCGCYRREKAKLTPFKHGMIHTPLYWVWSSIKERIFNKNTKSYKDYGGRGISLFAPWQVDFQLFHDYVSALPHFGEKGYSLDRIDNNGNYEPGNLRWTSHHIQAVNSRKRKTNKSGFTGVAKIRNKWVSYIYVNKIRHHLGYFKSPQGAVNARNEFIKRNQLSEYLIQNQ